MSKSRNGDKPIEKYDGPIDTEAALKAAAKESKELKDPTLVVRKEKGDDLIDNMNRAEEEHKPKVYTKEIDERAQREQQQEATPQRRSPKEVFSSFKDKASAFLGNAKESLSQSFKQTKNTVSTILEKSKETISNKMHGFSDRIETTKAQQAESRDNRQAARNDGMVTHKGKNNSLIDIIKDAKGGSTELVDLFGNNTELKQQVDKEKSKLQKATNNENNPELSSIPLQNRGQNNDKGR